jgi:MHS family proline/betaine transporter-like MFS transporter
LADSASSESAAFPDAHVAVPRVSLAIAAFSTIVEWYDFTLYLYLAPTLARVFFGESAHGLMITLGAFALAYLMRPLGAAFFGHGGDRWGRRRTMLWSMELMAIAMLITGLLPSSERLGAAAGVLLVLMRCVMAFSVGGEYNGVIAYLVEGAKPERRGFIGSLAAAASEVGGLLAVAVAAAVTASMDRDALDDWGWRIPFVVGALLAGGVWFARRSMAESPAFLRIQQSSETAGNPLRRALREDRRGILRAFAISALGSVTYYVGITYVPTFLSTASRIGEQAALSISTVAAVAVIAITPLVGLAVDAFGRRPVLVVLALFGIALPWASFALMTSSSIAIASVAAVLLALLAGGVSAVGAVASAEQFPTRTRLSGLALGNTSSTVVFGGLAPVVAQILLERTGWPSSPGILIAFTALAVLPVFVSMPETSPRRIDRALQDKLTT